MSYKHLKSAYRHNLTLFSYSVLTGCCQRQAPPFRRMRYNDNTISSSLAPCLKIRINWSMVRGISSGARAAISCSVKNYFRCIGVKHASREHVSHVQYCSVFSNIVAHGKELQSYSRCVGHLCFHRLRFHCLLGRPGGRSLRVPLRVNCWLLPEDLHSQIVSLSHNITKCNSMLHLRINILVFGSTNT